nr:myoneurin-like isoform X3 [Biomphalaria glabrata]
MNSLHRESKSLPYTCSHCHKGLYDKGSRRKYSSKRRRQLKSALHLPLVISQHASTDETFSQFPFRERGKVLNDQTDYCTLCNCTLPFGVTYQFHFNEVHASGSLVGKLGAQRWSLHDKSFKKVTRNYVNTSSNYHVKKQQTIGYISPLPSENVIQKGSHSTFSSSGSLGCPYCSQVFSCDYYLKSHLSDVHGSMMPFTCRLCGKGYLSQRGLIHHKHAHFGKKFMCPVCGKRFTQKFTSKTHLRNIHNSTQCRLAPLTQSVRQDDQTSQTFMDQMFKSKKVHKSTLGMRGPMSLDGINNFLCPNCNLEFPNKSALQSHNSECLKCSICAVKFSYKHELKMHLSQQHGQNMPFSCHLCHKGYQTSMGLTYHIRGHEGKFYNCPVCDAQLTQKSSLKYHLKNVHGVTQCNTCSAILKLGPEFKHHVLNCF